MPGLERYAGADCLVVGIGNVGRQDDGLGWAFVDRVEAAGLGGGAELLRTYQLHLEDADLIRDRRRVLFVDSTTEAAVADFSRGRPQPRLEVAFTSHALTVPTVLETCRQCFGVLPEVEVLAIRGYGWDLVAGLTPAAEANLTAALAAMASPTTVVPPPLPSRRTSR